MPLHSMTLLLLVLTLSAGARADTIYVPDDEAGIFTIADGIMAASDGDEVVLLNALYSGPGNRALSFGGRNITVRSLADDPATCTIDCGGVTGAFLFRNGETSAAVLRGVTIGAGAGFDLDGEAAPGGAVHIDGASPMIIDCAFQTCAADPGGGAIAIVGGSPRVMECVFAECTTDGDGGAIQTRGGTPFVSDCTFNTCIADGAGGAIDVSAGETAVDACSFLFCNAFVGGAIHVGPAGRLAASGSTFANNESGFAGGAVYDESTAAETYTDCTFTANIADINGGALEYAPTGTGAGASLTLTGCDFAQNVVNFGSGGGAGVSSVTGGTTVLTECTFSDQDIGTGFGGALQAFGGSTTLQSCSIQACRAGYGGAIYAGGDADDPGHLALVDTTLDSCIAAERGGGIYASAGQVSIRGGGVLHCSAHDSGGGTFVAGSGSATFSTMETAFVGNASDIGNGGAVMAEPGVAVDLLDTSFQENTAQGTGSAVRADVHTLTVRECAFVGNVSTHGIYGALAVNPMSAGGDILIDECSFVSNTARQAAAAAVLMEGPGNLLIVRCAFIDNVATESGGVMFLWNQGEAVIRDCDFARNAGGALTQSGAPQGPLLIVSCRFWNNVGNEWSAGALDLAPFDSVTIANCQFVANSAPSSGWASAIRVQGHAVLSALEIVNCTLLANDGPNGAIVVNWSPAMIRNSILWNPGAHEIVDDTGVVVVAHSDVEGGWPGAGNIDVDPQFINPSGPDGVIGTEDDDLRLAAGSPANDAGDNAALPPDTADLDGDGDVTEPLPIDIAGLARRANDRCAIDTGSGAPPIVDMGAHERPGAPCAEDVDGDGVVATTDLLALLADWGPCADCATDFDCDGAVSTADLLALLAAWGPCD